MDKERAKEIALKVGKHVEFCSCKETVPMLGHACDFCRDEQIRDYNYVSNFLDIAN